MVNKNYQDAFSLLLAKNFAPIGYELTKKVELDPLPESSKYEGLTFSLNDKKIVYRKGKVTPDRPGAFLAAWQRPALTENHDNKPIPLTCNELDYLFIKVESHQKEPGNETLVGGHKRGLFIFPVSLLIQKGIVSSTGKKGKTGFRVFPPWSQDRGIVGTKVFSESGKKTQRWQLPYFIEIDENGLIDADELNKVFSF